MVNKVTLIGNLGRDPELFQTQNGRAVARLSIATNEVWMKDGERQRRTEWHRVVVWGPRAERTMELRKGMPVYVEGRLRPVLDRLRACGLWLSWARRTSRRHSVHEIAVGLARQQPWARPGAVESYRAADLYRRAMQQVSRLRGDATGTGDTPAAWDALARVAMLETDALALESALDGDSYSKKATTLTQCIAALAGAIHPRPQPTKRGGRFASRPAGLAATLLVRDNDVPPSNAGQRAALRARPRRVANYEVIMK
jgi:single stranded DNA-binding protein